MFSFFFFNDTATTEIYPLSLHAALPISPAPPPPSIVVRARPPTGALAVGALSPLSPGKMSDAPGPGSPGGPAAAAVGERLDRKSTRLNSSHSQNSDAGFCFKKKKTKHAS